MPEDYEITTRDLLHPSNIITAILLGFAFSVYHRPYLPMWLPSYQRFDALMPWPWWGWSALLIAVLMLTTRRGSGWRLIAHAAAGTFWLAVAGSFAAGSGITSAATTYTLLACVSGVLFARSMVFWWQGMGWWRQLVDQPPRWLRVMAGLEPWRKGRGQRGGG